MHKSIKKQPTHKTFLCLPLEESLLKSLYKYYFLAFIGDGYDDILYIYRPWSWLTDVEERCASHSSSWFSSCCCYSWLTSSSMTRALHSWMMDGVSWWRTLLAMKYCQNSLGRWKQLTATSIVTLPQNALMSTNVAMESWKVEIKDL